MFFQRVNPAIDTLHIFNHPKNFTVQGVDLGFPVRYPLDGWPKQDTKEPRKQRHMAMRIYKRLKTESNFPDTCTDVKRYVTKRMFLLNKQSKGYLPLTQVDFGDFKYYDSIGGTHEGTARIVSFPYSNNR